jgi:hypothetical protein
MDINNLKFASFGYLKYAIDIDGNPRASTSLFYGPWDSAD